MAELNSVVRDTRRVDKLGEAYDAAIDLVTRKLKGEKIDPDDVELASRTVAQWSKVRQTDNARRALDFMMSRALTSDRDELRTMVVDVAPVGDEVAGALMRGNKNGSNSPTR